MFSLFLIFLVLKLCGVIAWSWWYVSLPLWILPAIGIAVLGVYSLVMTICLVFLMVYDRLKK